MTTVPPRPGPDTRSRARLWWGLGFLGYLAAHLLAEAGQVWTEADTPSYFQLSFLGNAQRPWVVPFAYAVLPGRGPWLVGFQIVVAAAAWMFLAWVLAPTIATPWLRGATIGVVLAVGLSQQVALWNTVVTSESLGISLMVAFVASSIWCLRRLDGLTVTVWCTLEVLWLFTRQLNLLLALPIALVVLVIWVGTRRRGLLAMVAVSVVVALWSAPFVLNSNNQTAEFNRLSVISERVMTNPSMRADFVRHGMPVSPALVAERHFGGAQSPLWHDAPLRSWARHHFVTVYGSYVAARPVWAATAPFSGAASRLLGSTRNGTYGSRRNVIGPLDPLLAGPNAVLFALWALVAVALAVVATVRRGPDRRGLGAVALMLVTAYALLLGVWHLSTHETLRLNVSAGVLLRLSVFLLLAWSLDRILTKA